MRQSRVTSCSVSQFCLEYDDYLGRLRGLSASTRKLHRYVARRFLTLQFPGERINWSQLRFTHVVDFLREEFCTAVGLRSDYVNCAQATTAPNTTGAGLAPPTVVAPLT